LNKIEPTINGPFTPDLATPVSKFGEFVKQSGWKDEFSSALIGSCTNSSYEDMVRSYPLKKASLLIIKVDKRGSVGETGQGGWIED
jgi:homoaconitase